MKFTVITSLLALASTLVHVTAVPQLDDWRNRDRCPDTTKWLWKHHTMTRSYTRYITKYNGYHTRTQTVTSTGSGTTTVTIVRPTTATVTRTGDISTVVMTSTVEIPGEGTTVTIPGTDVFTVTVPGPGTTSTITSRPIVTSTVFVPVSGSGTISTLISTITAPGTTRTITSTIAGEGTNRTVTSTITEAGTTRTVTSTLTNEGMNRTVTSTITGAGTTRTVISMITREGTNRTVTSTINGPTVTRTVLSTISIPGLPTTVTTTITASGTGANPDPTATPPVCTLTSVIRNSGFEDSSGNSSPWNIISSQGNGQTDNRVGVPANPTRSGTRSLLFRIPRSDNANSFITIAQSVRMCVGRRYNFSAWTRSTNAESRCAATFSIDGVTLATSDPNSALRTWTQTTAEYMPTVEFQPVSVRVVCPGTADGAAEGFEDFWLDDVEMTLAAEED